MNLSKKIFYFGLLLGSSLAADIQQVTLIWQPGLCGAPCIKNLQTRLTQIPAVAKVDMDQGTGRAIIVWKPDALFSFAPINAAARYVGIRVDDIRLKVRGKIVEEAGQIKLISSGDGTAFVLLNPAIPQKNQYTNTKNPATRKLSPELTAQLLEAKKNGWTVTIEGPFFEPYRSPPNNLVVEQLNVIKPDKK